MATMPPQSQSWKSDRAVLFVHGIGNAKPGDYTPLVEQLQEILGDDAKKIAFYFLYYDQVNDWFADKLQAANGIASLVQIVRGKLDTSDLSNVVADVVGDVIWPVLIADARQAVRAAILQQLEQIVLDGKKAGFQPRSQHLTIIAHSLGCFHVYEAMWAACADPAQGLGPASAGVRLDNLIFMASPVQLIGTVAKSMGKAVPQRDTLFSVSQPIAIPTEPGDGGQPIPCARRTISISGNLDPVGGYFFRDKLDWAYMALDGQLAFIDEEQVASVNGNERATLTSIFQSALQNQGPPTITPNNPHDWSAYIQRHASDLKSWITEAV
ncbi:MAG: hypothetical protein ABJE47_10000 [bacterium]